jgi:hypothetical protein
MKAFLSATVLLGLLTSASQAAPVKRPAARASASAPAFEFKGVTAGSVIDPTTIGTCNPANASGVITCSPSDRAVAGLEGTSSPILYFYKGRLTQMLYLFHDMDFTLLNEAFTSKYGRPCAVTHPKWQSKGGATFDNTLVTWCFKTGKLVLTAISVSRDYGDATYTDTYQAPSKSVPVDF